MKKKNLKYILYSIPLLVGGYLIYKQFAGKKQVQDVPLPPPPSPVKPDVSMPSDFPLRNGSRNSNVGALQSLLNTALQCKNKTLLSVDNIFGGKTEAALMELTGKTSVNSSKEFEAIKSSLSSVCSLSANLAWAWKMIDAQNTGKYSFLIVNQPISLYKVVKDFTGKWIPAVPKKSIELAVRSNYNLNDYKLRSATSTGGLRIEITRGELAGMWITNPNVNIANTFNIS
jgi:hypothetical protein